ncbi:MAG TPA: acVLRF1 family peptidyl-tRNA hydrolase [Pseudonocardiaceae bacterium]|nr:acVLRF1 family peptidyl-tRNA hydrolase [Pseudonocardiaceae bacterium]
MSRVRSAAGGGKSVEVTADRIVGWFARFTERHQNVRSVELSTERLQVEAVDGATASAAVPFAPLLLEAPVTDLDSAVGLLVEHLARPRLIGLVLVRLGGHSIGIARGGTVLASTTDHLPVHGRNKAGGWSQQRFARRRVGQARVAVQHAAADVRRVLGPRVGELSAVVLGGDPRVLAALRAEPGLAEVFALAQSRVLDVPEPRRTVLDEAAKRVLGLEILVREPD